MKFIYKGRAINKILCLAFAPFALACLAFALFGRLSDDEALMFTGLILSAAFGAFALLYGYMWFIEGLRESKEQKAIESIMRQRFQQEGYSPAESVFDIPREELAATALTRFKKVCIGLPIAAAVVFVLLYGSMLVTMGFMGFGHLLAVAAFCLLITIPGYVIQAPVYFKYKSALPNRVALSPDALIIGNDAYDLGKVEEVVVSAPKVMNVNSPTIYRSITVKANSGSKTYHIDFRKEGKDNPRWSGYDALVESMEQWAAHTGVNLIVDYMN